MTQLNQGRNNWMRWAVDFAGFIFYPKSPRYVVPHLSGEQLKKAKVRLGKVGVFVHAPLTKK